MDSSNTGLIISVISLLSALIVSVISTLSGVWQKTIEASQKDADRNQELRKIYVMKKIDAGEAAISGISITIKKVEWLDAAFHRHGLIEEPHESGIDAINEQEKIIDNYSNELNITSRDLMDLYFDTDEENAERINKAGKEWIEAAIHFRLLLYEKVWLSDKLYKSQLGENVDELRRKLASAYTEIEKFYPIFNSKTVAYKKEMSDISNALRKELRKYDMA